MRKQGDAQTEHLAWLSTLCGRGGEQKPDPQLIAGGSLSQSSPAPTHSSKCFSALLHLQRFCAHQRERRKPLNAPFPSHGPPPPRDQRQPSAPNLVGRGFPITQSLPATRSFPLGTSVHPQAPLSGKRLFSFS